MLENIFEKIGEFLSPQDFQSLKSFLRDRGDAISLGRGANETARVPCLATLERNGLVDASELAKAIRATADHDEIKSVCLDTAAINGDVRGLFEALATLPSISYVSISTDTLGVMSSLEWARYRLTVLSMCHGCMVSPDRVVFFYGDPIAGMVASFRICYESMREPKDLLRCEINLEDNETIWEALTDDERLMIERHLYKRVKVWLCSEGVFQAEDKEPRVSDASTVESI
jgi:hypothetical protein